MPALEGSVGAIFAARKLAFQHPNAYFCADRYSKPANWQVHERTTAAEIWQETAGESLASSPA